MKNYRILETMGKFYIQQEFGQFYYHNIFHLIYMLYLQYIKKTIPTEWITLKNLGAFDNLPDALLIVELIKKGDVIHLI